jgi:hypothetical protein
MKKYILVLLLGGCTTYVDNDQYLPPIGANFQQNLAQQQIQASQLNQLVSGIVGPNSVSSSLLQFQNYNREINAVSQNPWLGFFQLRNLWLPQ